MQDSIISGFGALLKNLNEEFIISISNKGTLKRALKEMEGKVFEIEELEHSISVQGDDFKVELTTEPSKFKCTCPSRSICKHVIIGYLYIKNVKGDFFIGDLKEENLIVPKEKKSLTKKEVVIDLYDESIKALNYSKDIIYELFKIGLAKCQRGIINDLEQGAIFCKGGNLTSLEKKIRIIITEVSNYLDKSSLFDFNNYLNTITRVILEIKQLEEMPKEQYNLNISKKDTYNIDVSGEFLTVGGEYFKTKSGFEGVTIFLYSKELDDIFTITNARGNIYNSGVTRRELWALPSPWGIGGACRNLLSLRIRLNNLRSNSNNRLTTSKEVTCSSCDKFRGRDAIKEINFINDFKEIKYDFERINYSFIYVSHFGEVIIDSITLDFSLDIFDINKNVIRIKIKNNVENERAIEKMKNLYKNGLSEYVFCKIYSDDIEKVVVPISFFDNGSIINIFE